MSENEVPFYAQAAVLDCYSHSPNPAADPAALEVVLSALEEHRDLQRYFFSSGPSAAWASILLERGFFDRPPASEEAEEGYRLLLYYLVDVAAQVPQVVLDVVESIKAEGWYRSLLVRAVCGIPDEQAVKAVPTIIEWLDYPQISPAITDEVVKLIVRMAEGEQLDTALELLDALLTPVPSTDLKTVGGMVWGGEARSKFLSFHDYDTEIFFKHHLPKLAERAPSRVVAILQNHLCTAIGLEAEAQGSPDFATRSWWRTAVEDTGQDLDLAYRDHLLPALRDALEVWVQKDASAVEPLLKQYLSDERSILRRLGLHILRKSPAVYTPLVVAELRRFENLDDTSIHHEFFTLLEAGFPLLQAPDQEALLATICAGPSPDDVRELAEWTHEQYGIDKEEYSQAHTQRWIRDRLLMVDKYLSGKAAETLKRLLESVGPPEIPPSFTRWSSGGFQVRDIAPVSEQEISKMLPGELVKYVQEWKPDSEQAVEPELTIYRGLANAIATVVLATPQTYTGHLAELALARPEYAFALLNRTREEKPGTPEIWEFSIELCETVLEDRSARSDMSRAFEVRWAEVRRAIVHLIQLGLNNEQYRIPASLLLRARDIIFVLLDDPDPDVETDHPPEGWFGHNDPATIAFNAVRPNALVTLIEYARLRFRLDEAAQGSQPEGPGPSRLEPIVREALTRKLDRRDDPSWAVHSVYGRYLPLLFYLDQEWVETHIEQILPEGKDEDSITYFRAAWDSFVAYNRFYSPIFELLRSKYVGAVSNLSKGLVTQTHFGPDRGLAIHIAWEYLLSGYSLQTPAGPQNLIALFFQEAPSEARGGVPWLFWRVLEENPNDVEAYWPKIRDVWEWRAKEASAANHSTEFDAEMRQFANLLAVVPEFETVASLWPLLEALLPHITRSTHLSHMWLTVEKHLATEVDRDPLRVIQFYRLMHDQQPQVRWYHGREESRKIIGTAAADEDVRTEALSLIDLLARRGNHQFQDIYDRYAG